MIARLCARPVNSGVRCLLLWGFRSMYNRIININNTLKAVCNAVASAEATTKGHIKLYYPNANEEFITFAFYGHIKHELNEASRNKYIERAFLEDLKFALRHQWSANWEVERRLNQRASGLVADIVLHNKRQEAKTGGDFGLIIVHPQIIINSDFLEVKKGQSSGLLCQAKLKDKNNRWGSFTKKQKSILPNHMDFTSLVLYSYLDKERVELNPVAWKLCRGNSIPEIEEALKKNPIEETLNTSDIITGLGRREIGTSDQNLIEQIVSPSARQHLELRIYWPKDDDPKEPIKVGIRHQQNIERKAYVRVHRT